MFLEYKEEWEENKDTEDYENYIDYCSEWFEIIEKAIEP